MSTSRDHGAVLYVVSRSGKVLGSEERSGRIVNRDYFEGELEGWIFWGSSSKESTSSHDRDRGQDGFIRGSGSKGFISNAFDSAGRRVSWTARIPSVVWGDETDSMDNFFSPLHWTQRRLLGRTNTTKGTNAGGWEDANMEFDSSLVGCLKSHDLFRSERWYRMELCYKIGFAQVAILQKSDTGGRWDPGTRELAARWAAWLLKMLRKTRSRPLQHLLFTMLSAVLPVICCSLGREQWNRVPDQELCRSVEIVWRALEKSYACFTSAQSEILEERVNECRKMQKKLEGLTGSCPGEGVPTENLKGSWCGEQVKQPYTASQGSYQQCSINSRDEQLSNILLKTEGAQALVKRAVREKLSTQQSRSVDGKGFCGFSGGSGRIVSLKCPISSKRIKVPARGRNCSHLSSFDLESFLEEHAKNDWQRSNSGRQQQKKPKVETGAWCCPICGSDATWPQIVVDGVLSRILEVLPEHMPEVCLLPNGRWRMVWSPVGRDLGQNDTKLTTVAVHLPFNSVLKDDVYRIGRYGNVRHDTCEAIDHCLDYEQSCGCRGVQILHRAYKAWEDEVDHLSIGNNADQSKLHGGANSTIAVWTDSNSFSRAAWQPPAQELINNKELRSIVNGEITESVNDMKVDSGIEVVGNVARISETETDGSQKIKAGKCEIEIPSTRKSIFDTLGAPEKKASICEGAQLRIGQHKSRPKLMAKKT